MLESMTGFSSIEHSKGGVAFTLSLRSVNSRFLELRLRLPKALGALEADVEKIVRAEISRGRLDLDLHVVAESATLTMWRANLDRATAIRDGLSEIGAALDLPNDVQLTDIARVGGMDLFEVVEDTENSSAWKEQVLIATRAAVKDLKRVRQEEGAALSAELQQNIQQLSEHLASIEGGMAEVLAQMRQRMTHKINERGGASSSGVSPERMEYEVLLLIERADIREELVRLQTHLNAFEKTRTGTDETRGKRLDFLLQEILREANTLGSKVPDAEIRNRVVDMKVLIEQLRQQVANVA